MSARLMTPQLLSLATLSRRFVLMLMALVTVAAAGCRTTSVIDTEPSPIPPKLTQWQIEEAILHAGDELGWDMQRQRPGLIVGTRVEGSRIAVVEIPYNSRTFRIRYKDSYNLNYNATNHSIHKTYTSWVKKLDRAILGYSCSCPCQSRGQPSRDIPGRRARHADLN